METMFVKPKAGLKIRMPDRPTETLPAKGANVPKNQFWLRRLNEGSVELGASTAAKKETGGSKS